MATDSERHRDAGGNGNNVTGSAEFTIRTPISPTWPASRPRTLSRTSYYRGGLSRETSGARLRKGRRNHCWTTEPVLGKHPCR